MCFRTFPGLGTRPLFVLGDGLAVDCCGSRQSMQGAGSDKRVGHKSELAKLEAVCLALRQPQLGQDQRQSARAR